MLNTPIVLKFISSELYSTSNLEAFCVGIATDHFINADVAFAKVALTLINSTGNEEKLKGVGTFSPGSPALPSLFRSIAD